MKAANAVRHRLRKVLGEYELGKQLGRGKFGVVKLVTHVETKKEYAMKVINKKKIKDSAEMIRIRREAEVLTNLDHPYIVNLQEVFETKKYVCIVMEYAAGGDLFHYIIKQPGHRLEFNEALRLMRQMTAAVAYCHVHYVVHRDLKPENIFLDEHKNVKIGDFGFSRTFRPDAVLDTPCGSLAYAAPEVISGKVYSGPAADLWSLACILYVMIVGELPFDAETDYQVVQNIKRGNWHDSPHLLNQSTRKLLRRMLQPNPKARVALSEVQRSPVLWQDRPLLGMLIKPFADVFAAKKPYSEKARPLLHRSFSDSEISTIETSTIKPFKRKLSRRETETIVHQRRSSDDTSKVEQLERFELAVSPQRRVPLVEASTPTDTPAKVEEPARAEKADNPPDEQLDHCPGSSKAADEPPEPESCIAPVILVDGTEELAVEPPTITASPAQPSDGSDVEVILVLPDLMDDEAPPMVVLERTWDLDETTTHSDSDLAQEEVKEPLPKEPSPTSSGFLSAYSGNTLQVPQIHRRRSSHSFSDDTVTTLFTTHKHPKERFRM